MARSTDRDREQARVALDATLVSVFSGDRRGSSVPPAGHARHRGRRPRCAESRTRLAVVAAMAAVIACRFDVAADYAARAADAADAAVGLSAELTRMVGAVVLMTDAMAGTANASRQGITPPAPLPGDSGPRRTSVRARRDDLLTRYLSAEAALSVAEFDVAEQTRSRVPGSRRGAGERPYRRRRTRCDGRAAGAHRRRRADPPASASAAQRVPGRAAQARVIGEGFAAAGVAAYRSAPSW